MDSLQRLLYGKTNMELVVAISENFVIGNNGFMPWHLPADLAHFKSITSSHTILMGRKTFESIGKPLPNRTNIVLTRQQDIEIEGAVIVHTIEDAINAAGESRLFLIGGGELYWTFIDYVTVLHITRVHVTVEGDTFFPQINKDIWELESEEKRLRDDKNAFDMTFETWQRRSRS